MKTLLLFLALTCITVAGYSQSAEVKQKIKTLMLDEPKVKDYVYTDANVLYASVVDDGTSRNGYAQYLYYELKGKGIKPFKVVIVKLGSQKDPKRENAYGVKLGEYKE